MAIIVIGICILYDGVHSQFYVKTHKSIPRIGRRKDPSVPMMEPELKKISDYSMELYDVIDLDKNGLISDEELDGIRKIRRYPFDRIMKLRNAEVPEYRRKSLYLDRDYTLNEM
ncbi:Uncharacterised protein g4356 [Pycnogonum litorale]